MMNNKKAEIKFGRNYKDEVTGMTLIPVEHNNFNPRGHFIRANVFGKRVPEYKHSDRKLVKYTAVVDFEQSCVGDWLEFVWEGTENTTRTQAKKEMAEYLTKFKQVDIEYLNTDILEKI